jgi:hypothetical protein
MAALRETVMDGGRYRLPECDVSFELYAVPSAPEAKKVWRLCT